METEHISLRQFFTTLLIKKGRGIWPDDALATSLVKYPGTGANSISAVAGKDKSDAIVKTFRESG